MGSIGDETDTAGNIAGDLACPLQHREWNVAPEMETSWWQEGQTKDAGPPATNSGPRRSSIHWLVGTCADATWKEPRKHAGQSATMHFFFGRRFLVED